MMMMMMMICEIMWDLNYLNQDLLLLLDIDKGDDEVTGFRKCADLGSYEY